MKTKSTALALASAVFLSGGLIAQAPVVDRTLSAQNQEAAQTAAVRNNYLEIQALREEISSLRGLVEELSYELRKVQQRQSDDYQDLDNRISAASTGVGVNTPSAAAPVPAVATAPASGGDSDHLYRTGFMALRDGDRAEAVRIFESLVNSYPGSNREADSLYWLGETHWLNLDVEKSRRSFTKLLNTYPDYRKAADAQYRLGLIYAQLGDQESAIRYMRGLAEGTSSHAEAAKTYLQEQGAL